MFFLLSGSKVIDPCWVALHISGAQHRSSASLFRPTYYYIIIPAYSGPLLGPSGLQVRALPPSIPLRPGDLSERAESSSGVTKVSHITFFCIFSGTDLCHQGHAARTVAVYQNDSKTLALISRTMFMMSVSASWLVLEPHKLHSRSSCELSSVIGLTRGHHQGAQTYCCPTAIYLFSRVPFPAFLALPIAGLIVSVAETLIQHWTHWICLDTLHLGLRCRARPG